MRYLFIHMSVKYKYQVKKWSEVEDDAEIYYPLGINSATRSTLNDLLALACAWTLGVYHVTASYEFLPKLRWLSIFNDYHASYGQSDRVFNAYEYVIVRTKNELFALD